MKISFDQHASRRSQNTEAQRISMRPLRFTITNRPHSPLGDEAYDLQLR
jgi:hypothetical protein